MAIRTKNSTQFNNSRYVQGGITDIYPNRLGWWERRELTHADDDIIITITKDIEKRPDLIGYNLYKKVNLGWVILQYNKIIDIETELLTGTIIRAPSVQRLVLGILSKQVGGNIIQS